MAPFDPLFRSAAVAHVIGIMLTGMLDDGTVGLMVIKRCGGVTMVQDPKDAAYPHSSLTVGRRSFRSTSGPKR
jgi:chemotaxis response regulator CheB